MTRVQAPKQSVDPPEKVHPDFFWCWSGGIDSTAAYLITRKALHENFGKRPIAVHWDTGVGLPLNRLYLEELADHFNEQLVTWRTQQSLERYVEENDAPGPGAHEDVRKLLKGQQSSKLSNLATLPVYIIGLRAGESNHRASLPKVVVRRTEAGKIRHVEIYPVHRLTKVECARIILEADAPINPCWLYRHPTDCCCFCNGDPSEKDRIVKRFPKFGQRLDEIEEAANANGLRSQLGWGGLSAIHKKAIRQGQQQTTLTVCGDGCERKKDPVVVEAFRERIEGASRREAISLLDNATPGRVVA